MEASTSNQPVHNAGSDQARSSRGGGSRGSRGRPRRGRGGKTNGAQAEIRNSSDAVPEVSKPDNQAPAAPVNEPVMAVVNEGSEAHTKKKKRKRTSVPTSAQVSEKPSNGLDNAKDGENPQQQQSISRPRANRPRKGRGRGAGPTNGTAKRPSVPLESVQPQDATTLPASEAGPSALAETPAAAAAEPTAKRQVARVRLQADMKERLQKRVMEAVVSLGNSHGVIVDSQREQKQEEEVKAEQDEQDVENELIGELLEETTEDEDEEEEKPGNAKGTKDKGKVKRKKKKLTKAEKAAKQEAHFQLVMEAARTVVRILEARGIYCAVFGSLAARLYGAYRCPKDVDMLVLQDPSIPAEQQLTAEQLKVMFLDFSPVNFYLKLPRNPEDTYRILHYRREYLGMECKVDILVPGTMYLPHSLPPNDPFTSVRWVDHIPLVPFGLLLLHKLQGWDDHRLAEEEFRKKKQVQDALDVKKIMAMNEEVDKLVRRAKKTGETSWWRNPDLFSEEFQDLTKRRVDDFCREFLGSRKGWKALGLDVPDSAPTTSSPQAKTLAAEPSEAQFDADAQALSPHVPHELDLQHHPQSESAISPRAKARMGPIQLPRVKEVLDGVVTEGTLYTPDPDDPVSPDELVCRVGGLTGAPELVPVVGGGRMAALQAPAVVSVTGGG